ncbi:helix-turn-helix domain-containing protein [Allopontixanthobacter sediminis]|uniref:Helix-turn-helix domain-containing protein n=1 Tax=Allopontixanthobacter sediminis TaxID=1689985 RepID=A0A845ATQ9_9SPHN|nr:helix-turn-helix domain-containing protein [Allopontixanthobacter sediminis]
MSPALLTEHEAAEALRVCTRTLRKARQEGALPYVRFGRTIRYTESDLTQFIEKARECHSTSAKAPRSGGTRSQSTVCDFEAALKKRASAKPAK